MAHVSFFAGEHGVSLAWAILSAPPNAQTSHTPLDLSAGSRLVYG